jgi:hypothetical protein
LAWVHGCPWAWGRDYPKVAEDVAAACQAEQATLRQQGVVRRAGRGVAVRELEDDVRAPEDVGQVRHRVLLVASGAEVGHVVRAERASVRKVLALAAKLELLASLQPEALLAELQAQQEEERMEVVSGRQAARLREQQKLVLTELQVRAVVQQPVLPELLARQALQRAARLRERLRRERQLQEQRLPE